MPVVKAKVKGSCHGDVSTSRCIGDFGISVFHGPGCDRPEASSLNRVRDSGAHIRRNPPPGVVFRFEPSHTVIVATGLDLPPRDSWHGGARGAPGPTGNSTQFQLCNSNYERKGLGYDIEGQEK